MDNLIEINASIHDDICTGSECCYYRVCRQSCGYCPKKIIRKAIKKRDEREQYIINLHCGFYDGKQYSFAEIGRRLGVTGTRVSQIYKEAVRSHKYKAYYGIPETIISYGGNSTGYAKFYHDVNYKPDGDKIFGYYERNYDSYTICGNHIPFEILSRAMEFKSENDVISKLRLSISDWLISEKLRKQLQNNGINNISDILSLPFFVLFFCILEFNYNLLVELIISLWEVIPNFRFACSPVNINYFCVADFNDDAKKLNIKAYIHNYIEEHGQFLTDYSNYDEWDNLKIDAERLRTASLISELWYTDSLHLLDEYGFDFQAYWRRVNQDGFSTTCETKLFEVIQNNYFPHSIKDISEQSIKSCICNLDISYCWLKHSLWKNLKKSGINTIGELLDYPENEYSKLYRAHPLMIDYLKQYVQNLKNFISTF